jgi:hypothetical protein
MVTMYAPQTGITASTIWMALAIGLLVQGAVIYTAVRLALIHHRALVKREDDEAARAARRKADIDAAAELKRLDAHPEGRPSA